MKYLIQRMENQLRAEAQNQVRQANASSTIIAVINIIVLIVIVLIFISVILAFVIMIHEDLLARVNDFLSDPLPVVEEAIVGQGVLEHVDLTGPLEYS